MTPWYLVIALCLVDGFLCHQLMKAWDKDAPPNVPLTLDELLGMNGEPVWIVGVSAINNFKGHWDICDWDNGEGVFFPYCTENPVLELLGVSWFAYRYKPKEGV